MSSAKEILINDIKNKFEEANEHLKKYSSEYNIYEYKLKAIKSIDGIDCDVILKFHNVVNINPDIPYYSVALHIKHNNMYCDEDVDGETEITLYYNNILRNVEKSIFDKESISVMLDDLKVRLQELKFNIYNGRFSAEVETISAQVDFFSDIQSIKMCGDKCSVCQEFVKTQTNCKHYLCVPCFQQIKLVESEDEDSIRPCPLCRKDINYTH
jgi:hypothetical protein